MAGPIVRCPDRRANATKGSWPAVRASLTAGNRCPAALRQDVERVAIHGRTLAFLKLVSSNPTCMERGSRNGGEGEIRTHVPELPDHPISSRRRYDRFGTSPRAKNTHSWIRAARSGARILAEQ